jgi:prepilin-type processing-associated H-X9-DG protein
MKLTQPGQAISNSSQSRAFTLLELLVITLFVGLLGLSLLPGIAKTHPNTRIAQCQNNLRQLTAAWSAYAADSEDRTANNFGINETVASITALRFENWANNIMTWGGSSSVSDISNTNTVWITKGVLGGYLGDATRIYHCPADIYRSPPQVAAGWPERTRSISMNAVFGRFSSGSDITAMELNWTLPNYRQYLKLARVPKPAKTWLVLEEHPDSINDGYFINNPSSQQWQDIPASWHNGGCSFSYVDGHTELKRWKSITSFYRVQFFYPATKAFDTWGRADFAWYLSRTGWVDARNGQPQFGY